MHVAGIQHDSPRELLPYANGPLLGVRLTHVAVDGEASGRRQWALERRVIHIRLRRYEGINEVLHSVERAIDVADFPDGGIVVDTKTTAQDGLAIAAQIVGKTDAWAETELGILAGSTVEERGHAFQWLFETRIDESALEFVAQAEIQRQAAV